MPVSAIRQTSIRLVTQRASGEKVFAVEEGSDSRYLRKQAAKCCLLAKSQTDEATRIALLNLAADYEEKATVADRSAGRIILQKPDLER